MDNTDEIKYIKRILDGETNLFSYFINRHSNAINALNYRIVQNKEDAEELTQDTFMKAYNKLSSFKGDCSFSTWLFSISYNTAVSATRKRKIVLPAIDDNMIESVADEDVDAIFSMDNDANLLEKLDVAINKLNIEEKSLITLYYHEDKSVAELAKILDISPENVKVKLFRVRKKLYFLINNNYDAR